jgi:ATP-dependent Clp protease ATP-binding subunit ClpA
MNGQPGPRMLIGRDDELQLIRDALAEATRRRPQMLVVSGDAGIGKSALAHEAVRLASDLAFTVLSGARLDVAADAAFCAGARGGPSLAALDAIKRRRHLRKITEAVVHHV